MTVPLKTVLSRLPEGRRAKVEARAAELVADIARTAPRSKKNSARFHVFKDDDAAWHWRLVAANGQTIASSGEAYRAKQRCLSAVDLVKFLADAEVTQD